MSKYANGTIDVAVKVYEQQESKAKPTEKGGYFQMLGQAQAQISFNDEVMFDKIYGMVGINYKNKAAYDAGQGSISITYANAYKADNGQWYDKVIVSEKMKSYLTVETMKAFHQGFAAPERDLELAANAGIEADEFLELSKAALAKAVSMKSEAPVDAAKGGNTKDAMAELDKELDSEVG